MEYDEKFSLILNHLSANEYMYLKGGEGYEEYKQMAYLFLNRKSVSFSEKEILSHYSDAITMEKLISQNPNRFFPAITSSEGKKQIRKWYDIDCMEEVEANDTFFDYFFIIKMRHLDLLELDNYLNYHLENSFDKDLLKFQRFLNLSVRKYDDKLLTEKIINTIKEWITGSEKELQEFDNNKLERLKGRIPREAGDHLTVLNLSQTALFIQYLQQARFILKGDNLNDTQAGKAFHILTGYSAHTIRQGLGAKFSIFGFKYEDYKELHQVVKDLLSLIENDLKKFNIKP